MKYKIAVINNTEPDGSARTVIDGLALLQKKGLIDFKLASEFNYAIQNIQNAVLQEEEFMRYADAADIILLIYCKRGTNKSLAEKIGKFNKTIFIDGSEIGKNGRYDFNVQNKIVNGRYSGNGGIDREMLEKCLLYFKREKPYKDGVIPFPFGIESVYIKDYSSDIKKDIDFFCVFGQDEYPLMRRYAREILIAFCKKNDFSCFTEKVERSEFYKNLARAKVGISIGGGGYDTLRFWEILGNDCLLLTEKIDVYEPDSKRLEYDRIWQFNDLFDFEYQLKRIGEYLRKDFNPSGMEVEYKKIISEHSSEARVLEIIERFKELKLP